MKTNTKQTTNEKRQSTRRASQKYNALFFAARLEGVPVWYIHATPSDLWTAEAFYLFDAAQKAGIISYNEENREWTAGSGAAKKITKGRLAYFCKKACWALHLNNGAHTNWAPFEIAFGYKEKTMRLYLHNVEESSKSKRLEDAFIDAFFETLETDLNPEQ